MSEHSITVASLAMLLGTFATLVVLRYLPASASLLVGALVGWGLWARLA